ncbi:tRNA pseudouridine(55) synthase TruB [Novosphingobium beihaiensis]|uniref:tRNA pseudouridine synthase B n=1 Tax=Novosphingobium beihaiensis TaxID=2930389 RepID=A0ABT0BV18_9SPHN|nr:tRNA pseudouridine(55) synthase TruB [Novosphingobium beihaiensis]MCJ2188920.1 tRNA pseudouridine(55) synthase TruB [Novosphingobium beihaiensis]
MTDTPSMPLPAPSGWIILDKPVGLGSTQAVAAVKRNLREAGYGKKVKVGHGGTLDPLASGILPVAVGEATKLTGRMLDASKVYEFTVRFGEETDTLDLEGAVISTSDVRPTAEQVAAVLPRFTGPIEQVPPAYSALKVDGQRAYDLARAGEDVKLKPRSVEIFELTILPDTGRGTAAEGGGGGDSRPDPALREDADPLHHPAGGPPPRAGEDMTFRAHVSKGTYIRSLARDIAQALGSCGTVTMLRRVQAGPFGLSHAISLDKLNETGKGAPLEQILLPLEAGLDDIPAIGLSPEQARAVRQGRVLTGLPQEDGLHWAREGKVPVALMELSGGDARVVRGFNLSDVAE